MIGRFEEAILSALFSANGEVTTNEIYEALLGKVKPLSLGAIYVTLDRMSKKSFITRRRGEPLPERGGKARYFYKISTHGRAALIEARNAFCALEIFEGTDVIAEP